MTTRLLVDSAGIEYDVPTEYLAQPPAGTQTRTLRDPSTGETFDLDASLFDTSPSPQPPQTQRSSPTTSAITPPPGYQEHLIKVILDRSDIPEELQARAGIFTSPLLAVGKVASRQDQYIAELRLENLQRAFFMSNELEASDSIFNMELLKFISTLQISRAITWDNKPNEREWLTAQSIHQKTDIRSSEGGTQAGGITGMVKGIFGKGRY